MSKTSSRVHRNGAAASAGKQKSTAEIPLTPGSQRTTSDLNESLLTLFDGVLDDSVSHKTANSAARIAGVIMKGVQLECQYGPQQERRKALPIHSTRAAE